LPNLSIGEASPMLLALDLNPKFDLMARPRVASLYVSGKKLL